MDEYPLLPNPNIFKIMLNYSGLSIISLPKSQLLAGLNDIYASEYERVYNRIWYHAITIEYYLYTTHSTAHIMHTQGIRNPRQAARTTEEKYKTKKYLKQTT